MCIANYQEKSLPWRMLCLLRFPFRVVSLNCLDGSPQNPGGHNSLLLASCPKVEGLEGVLVSIAMITSLLYKGAMALKLESRVASMVILPEIGGKIASLQSQRSGTEFLWQDDSRPYRSILYGDDFGNYDASGFDECFPTIGESPYPEFPWEGVIAPDHGELWCRPWRYELEAETVRLYAYGVRFPYLFEKRIGVVEETGGFFLKYQVSNLSPFRFKYLWSAHPLFAAQEGMRILLPGSPKTYLTSTYGNRIQGEAFQEYTWPWLTGPSGEPVDNSLIGSPDLDASDKVYLETPTEGWCALYRPPTGEFVGFTMSSEEVPFIGVCINHAAWPFTGARGYWVALEPCTGYPDPLHEVIARQLHATLEPYETAAWSLGLHIGQAATAVEVAPLFGKWLT